MNLDFIRDAKPGTAIVLGSGLGKAAEALGIEAEVSYSAIPGLPDSKVPGHSGRFALVRVDGRPVLVAQGRSHLYEGLSATDLPGALEVSR